MAPRGQQRPRAELQDEVIVAGLLDAYRHGAFPMGEPDGLDVHFYRPDPRGILPLEPERPGQPGFHVPATVRKSIRQGRFEFHCDTAFDLVVAGCAAARAPSVEDREGLTDPGTWINPTIRGWYHAMHTAGHAHSVEAWVTAYNNEGVRESRMVGGIYGVSIGAAFFGESMFHVPLPRKADGSRDPFDGTGAGQAALVVLVEHLRMLGYTLFDTQMTTNVTRRFGAMEVPLSEYLTMLDLSVVGPSLWKPLRHAGEATG